MAGKTAVLSLKIIGDATGAQKAAATTKKEISGLEKAMGGIKKGAAIGGAAAGAALMLGLNSAIENNTAQNKMSAALGLSPAEAEAAGKLTGDLYKNNFGSSMEEVSTTVDAVASTLAKMGDNGGADVQRLTEKALNLASAFPEVGDGISTAGVLMKTGLAKSADEAYDLMTASMQKVPAAMRGELIPVMDEYSTHFAALGFDGSTAFGIMSNAAEGGAIQMDKTGDALKEFTIRATDGSTTTGDALASIGLDATSMANDVLAGGTRAQDALSKITNGLTSIEDPAAMAQAAIALFGTPLEDLGTDKIPDFLNLIDPLGDSFDSVAGAADAMGATLNSGPGPALESLKRTATASFTEIAAAALPVLEPIIAVLHQFAPVLGPMAVAIVALAGMVWLVNGAMVAWTAVQNAQKLATVASTAAQWLFNAAMSANPIGLVILLIAGLIAGVVLAYQNIGWFKDAVNAAGDIAASVFSAIGDWIGSVVDSLSGMVGWVKDAVGWFGSLFGAKDKAASVDAGAAAPASFMGAPLMAAPALTGVSSFALMPDPAPLAKVAATPYAAPSSLASTSAALGTATRNSQQPGNTYVFSPTVSGSLDSNATVRKLESMFKAWAKQNGTRPAAGGFRA